MAGADPRVGPPRVQGGRHPACDRDGGARLQGQARPDTGVAHPARRPAQATLKWNRRLRGKQTLTLTDLTVIMRLLPNAMPTEGAIRRLLKVAEGGNKGLLPASSR